jgi:cyclic 2,3-diphosphoglycerate synthetase
MRVIALVDGEHHPPVTRWALASARADGFEVLAAVMVGGVEKLEMDASGPDLGDTTLVGPGPNPRRAMEAAIAEYRPEAVLDLSDEPVLSIELRMELAAVALAQGVAYVGPDFRFDPPIRDEPLRVPTLAVIGSGKRVGKTAIGGHVAAIAAAAGEHPVLVAMGRGGPPWPVTTGPEDVTLQALLARAERGEHAASDYLEDALFAGVPTIGARRAGGGLAGRPFVTNVADAARRAAAGGAGMVIMEGSGASLPTVPWDAGVLVMPASASPEAFACSLGPIRMLLSDLAVFIIDVGPSAGPDNLSALESLARRLRADIRVAIAELEPIPLADVRGKDAFFATTAHRELADRLADQLERNAGCRVVSSSSRLADRAGLEEDLAAAPHFDVLLTELKAAAVDVAARRALATGAEVVFVANRPKAAGGDGDLDDLLRETVKLAGERGHRRLEPSGLGE